MGIHQNNRVEKSDAPIAIRVDALENVFDLIAHVLFRHEREVVGVGVERPDHLVQLALVDSTVAVRVIHVEDELEALRNVAVHNGGQSRHKVADIDARRLRVLVRTHVDERAKPLAVGRQAECGDDAIERLVIDRGLAVLEILGEESVHAMQLLERHGKHGQDVVEQILLLCEGQ